jgi:hypothetical protein
MSVLIHDSEIPLQHSQLTVSNDIYIASHTKICVAEGWVSSLLLEPASVCRTWVTFPKISSATSVLL